MPEETSITLVCEDPGGTPFPPGGPLPDRLESRVVRLRTIEEGEWRGLDAELESGEVPRVLVTGLGGRLDEPLPVRLSRSSPWHDASADSPWARWVVTYESPGALGLRLELRDLDLPPGSEIWVVDSDDQAARMLLGSPETRSWWTPTTFGESGRLVVSVPTREASDGGFGSFSISDGFVAVDVELSEDEQLTRLNVRSVVATPRGSCYLKAPTLDVEAVLSDPQLEEAKRAVAGCGHLRHTSSGWIVGLGYSGALIRRRGQATLAGPLYLLVPNHSFVSECKASAKIDRHYQSFEAFFRYNSDVLGDYKKMGVSTLRPRLPTSRGACLVAASHRSDCALMKLDTPPAPCDEVTLLGWSTTPPADGRVVYRVSHPHALPQSYTEGRVIPGGELDPQCLACCESRHEPEYQRTKPHRGADLVGSSGAPLMVRGSSQIVGQLWGVCKADAAAFHYSIDGRFADSYPVLKHLLDP